MRFTLKIRGLAGKMRKKHFLVDPLRVNQGLTLAEMVAVRIL